MDAYEIDLVIYSKHFAKPLRNCLSTAYIAYNYLLVCRGRDVIAT